MAYHVKIIDNVDKIDTCELFQINHYQWSGSYRPKAYGRMGMIEKECIIISLTAEEKDPLYRYRKNDDPVYRDSALEVFLNFSPEKEQVRYLNFEMNSFGAMLSAFGGNQNRKFLRQLTPLEASCEAQIEEDSWSILLRVPMKLICKLYDIEPLSRGDRFTCNFYKISEDPTIEHYASYAPVDNPVPNFHLTEYFGEAVIEETAFGMGKPAVAKR